MSDINGTPHARILVAKGELAMNEQRVVIEQKELRLLELDEEQRNIEVDITRVKALQSEQIELAAKLPKDSIEARRHTIKAHEIALLEQGKNIRLLELDGERDQIAIDMAAATAHIAKTEAEVSQQRARLKETASG